MSREERVHATQVSMLRNTESITNDLHYRLEGYLEMVGVAVGNITRLGNRICCVYDIWVYKRICPISWSQRLCH